MSRFWEAVAEASEHALLKSCPSSSEDANLTLGAGGAPSTVVVGFSLRGLKDLTLAGVWGPNRGWERGSAVGQRGSAVGQRGSAVGQQGGSSPGRPMPLNPSPTWARIGRVVARFLVEVVRAPILLSAPSSILSEEEEDSCDFPVVRSLPNPSSSSSENTFSSGSDDDKVSFLASISGDQTAHPSLHTSHCMPHIYLHTLHTPY